MKFKQILENMMGPNEPMDDHEVEMAITDLRATAAMASELAQHLENERPKELEGWVQSKITKAADYINSVHKNHMHSPEQDCMSCDGATMKEAMEPKSAYGDQVYSNIEALKSAATKIMFKPENYSVLTDGNKFMLTTNRRAGIFAKEGSWKIIGKIDSNKNYREQDSNLFEATSTCCGRCGRKHVKGTSCPKPFLTGKRHCRNRD